MTSRDNSIIEALERRQLLSGVTIITHGQGGDAGGAVKQTADLMCRLTAAAMCRADTRSRLEGPAFDQPHASA